MRKTTIIALVLTLVAAGFAVMPASAQTAPEPPQQAPPPQQAMAHPPQAPDLPPMPSRAYLGVDTRDITKDRVAPLKLREESGVEVTMVDQDAPAGKAGLREHDVIVTFNGNKVESQEQLRRFVRETPVGRQVALGLMRDGQPVTLNVKLGDRREIAMKFAHRGVGPGSAPMPPMPPGAPMAGFMAHGPDMMLMDAPFPVAGGFMRLGMMVESLTPQLAEYFGAKNGAGLLVRSVDKGSIAEAGGIHAGDVIIRVDKEGIADIGDWRRVMHQKSGNVPVTVLRDKKEVTLTLKVPERKKDSGALRDEDFSFETGPELALLMDNVKIAEQAQKEVENALRDHRDEINRAMDEARKALDKQNFDIEINIPDLTDRGKI
ncbi:MAG TPA: PDZ domain-containing protein [Terriglobales bacterium]